MTSNTLPPHFLANLEPSACSMSRKREKFAVSSSLLGMGLLGENRSWRRARVVMP